MQTISSLSLSLAVIFLSLLLPPVTCNFVRGYFVFTARLSCRIPEKQSFRYRIQYFQGDLTEHDGKLTRYDNVGNGTYGEVLVNNYAKMYGNSFFGVTYKSYAMILHECTNEDNRMRQLKHRIGDCIVEGRNCNRKFFLDVTDSGESVEYEVIPDAVYDE